LGLCAEASAELEAALARDHHAPTVLPALPLFERCRRFDRSVQLASNLLGRAGPAERRALLGFAYPAAFAPAVDRASRRARLDPYLLLSIARRESVFRPDAHSAAGAVGLVQLLPRTAERIAAVLGRPAPDRRSLADPDEALELGAWYFAELYGAFGDVAIAAAAYNAGPRVVRGWLAGAEGKPLDEWVEEIPFRETRLYVRAVVGAWNAYRLLAGGSAPVLQKTVPAPRRGIQF
jgi:soluble lytic murein transglycosylase